MKYFKEGLYLIMGNLFLAFAVAYFIIPFNILSGGVAGVAVAIQPIVPLSTTTIINIIVLTTFILGAFFLGRDFVVKTVVSSILYPSLLYILQNYPLPLDIPPFLASLYGGVIGGVGIGLVFRQGGSTGGMDVLPLIVNKYTHIKIPTLILITDGLTVLLGMYTYGFEAVLIGLVSVYATGMAIDKVLVIGGNHAKTVYIISDRYQEILDKIHVQLDRGATVITARGGFTGEERQMILSVVPANQYPLLQQLVEELDDRAFLIVSDATEVRGEGFSVEAKI